MNGQFPLPLPATGAGVGPSRIVTACNQPVEDQLAAWDNWPYHAALLIGAARSGKSVFGRAFAEASGGTFVDDAQRCADDELFHAWNAAQHERRPILFAAPETPRHWGIALPDLLSRLNASQLVRVPAPDETLAGLLLQKHLADADLPIADAVAGFAAVRVERSYVAIERLAERLRESALEMKRPIGQKMVRDALEHLAQPSDHADDGADRGE